MTGITAQGDGTFIVTLNQAVTIQTSGRATTRPATTSPI